jgi:hypothetical protein
MIAHHIHDALAQVGKLRELIVGKRQFMGYSGKARILGGCAALVAAAVMSSDFVPPQPLVHLTGWSLVLAAGLLANYGAFAYWFLFNPQVRRNRVMAKPALDALPPLTVGAALSAALVMADRLPLLFGVWMCLFGLAQTAYRQSMPVGVYRLGLAYLACGFVCLLRPPSFVNPWPMGLTFFAGEVAGGIVLLRARATMRRTCGSS